MCSHNIPTMVIPIVNGNPARKYCQAVMRTFCPSAISATIRLAMEPVIVRLPAKVENSANPFHQTSGCCCGIKNFSNNTAGTLLTRLLNTTDTQPTKDGRTSTVYDYQLEYLS